MHVDAATPVKVQTWVEACSPAWVGVVQLLLSWEQAFLPLVLGQACCLLPQEKSFLGLGCQPSLF